MYHSRLFTRPRLVEIAEIADDIANDCVAVSDALADYENATGTDDRYDARDSAWAAIGDVLASADRLRVLRDRLAADDPGDDHHA